jgi:hypothetical protein
VTRPDIEQVQESSRDYHSSTYISRGAVREEYAVVDLHIGTTGSINRTALEVACSPPGIGAKKVQESFETKFGLLTVSAVLLSNVLS